MRLRETAVSPMKTPIAPGDDILIAQLPRAGKPGKPQRWAQRNYTTRVIETFFGISVKPPGGQSFNFSEINADGTFMGQQPRAFVPRASKNYGFELRAAAGRPYPLGADRPILISQKRSGNVIWDLLLMPGDPDYNTVNDYLQAEYSARKTSKRKQLSRVTVTTADLKKAWPASPF